jgi:hypothetical protein
MQAIPTERAVDAGALGFMAKFLVQTTLPHSEQVGTQYVRTDGNLTSASRMLAGPACHTAAIRD